MIKRSAIIGLLVLYIITVSGFALNLHYCFNRLASVSIDVPANTCAKVLRPIKMKCCKDNKVEVRVKDAHQSSSPEFGMKFFPVHFPAVTFASIAVADQDGYVNSIAGRGPPLAPDIPLFLKNRVFRI